MTNETVKNNQAKAKKTKMFVNGIFAATNKNCVEFIECDVVRRHLEFAN